MAVRIGDILLERGVLSAAQVGEIVDRQRDSARPFGQLAEEMFGVDPAEIEAAWLDQYAAATERVDPVSVRPDPSVLGAVSRRQAWQFRVLPVSRSGGELVLCTAEEHLGRALRFAANVLHVPAVVVLAAADRLEAALAEAYPVDGFDAVPMGRLGVGGSA